jgi:hypothetical protein
MCHCERSEAMTLFMTELRSEKHNLGREPIDRSMEV